MTRFSVKFQLEGEVSQAEVELQVDEEELCGDIVLRALAKHLHPAEQWPFPVEDFLPAENAGMADRVIRMRRIHDARRHLKLVRLTYRPEGRVLDLAL